MSSSELRSGEGEEKGDETDLLKSLLLLHLCQPPSTLLPLLGHPSELLFGLIVGNLVKGRSKG